MRPIDAEPIERELFKQADKPLAKNPYENARICAFRQALELILDAPTITPPPNGPLTPEELREMDGEPVWLEYDQSWVFVVVDDGVPMLANLEGERCKAENWMRLWGNIYRYKPEEGDGMGIEQQEPTDFRIVSAPVKIAFKCPHCGEYIEIPWREVGPPECWSDNWPPVNCPECGKSVELGEWGYD